MQFEDSATLDSLLDEFFSSFDSDRNGFVLHIQFIDFNGTRIMTNDLFSFMQDYLLSLNFQLG